MDRYLLGKEIKRRRVELKLTQKQLALGICKQSIISKIENGEFFPSFDLIVAISNRLKLSVSYLLESTISEEFYQINKTKYNLNYLIKCHKYDEAFYFSDRELQSNHFLFGEHRQYFVWARTTSAFRANMIDYDEAIITLERCLNDNLYYINQSQEMSIYNSIATIYADCGDYENAFCTFEKIISENKNKQKTHLYLNILFNYANFLHNYMRYEKTLLVINEALVICKELESTKMFGSFYFLKGECLKDLGYEKKEISNCFNKALFFFDLLHKDDYIKLLWDNYYDYL